MIPRGLPISNAPTSVDIDRQRVDESQDRDDGEGCCGQEGSAGGFGAEVDDEGGHRADVD